MFISKGTNDTLGEMCMCKYKYVTTINAERRLWDTYTAKLLDETYGNLFQNEPKENRNGSLC